jgi:selenocysteine lyase/cysteine desulfurase
MAASPLPDGLEIDAVKTRLYDQYKIEVPLVKWGEKNLIRYSYQAYNSRDDMEKLIAALTGILRG